MVTSQKLLSIVIPTYNMEKYLAKCLDSLFEAKEVLVSLEILIINDGSMDGSLGIARKYEAECPYSFRVIDKENGNYGSCINRGLKEATGKYIKILDADDWFDTEGLRRLVITLKDVDADLVLTDFYRVNSDGNVISKTNYKFPLNRILKIEDFCHQLGFEGMEMHAVTYRTDMVKKSEYRQTEGVSYTDQEWIFEPMSYVNTFYCTGIVVYQYLIGREGQTMSFAQLSKNISHTLKGMYAIFDSYCRRSSSCGKNMRLYMMYRMIIRLKYLYSMSLFHRYLDTDALIKLEDFIREKDKNVYEAAGNITINRFMPIRYVKWWRNHGRRELPKWMHYVYKLQMKLK